MGKGWTISWNCMGNGRRGTAGVWGDWKWEQAAAGAGTDRAADGKEAARGRRPHRRLLGRVCGVDGGIQAERIVFTTDFA